MKKLLLILCLLVGYGLHAQTIERHTFANAGGVLTNGSNSLQFTIGEPIIGLTGSDHSLDQGFWATFSSDITLGTDSVSLGTPEIGVYPNPVSDYLTVKMNHVFPYTATVYNASGQKMLEENMASVSSYSKIDMSSLSSGNYYMIISVPELQLNKTIKIIKN